MSSFLLFVFYHAAHYTHTKKTHTWPHYFPMRRYLGLKFYFNAINFLPMIVYKDWRVNSHAYVLGVSVCPFFFSICRLNFGNTLMMYVVFLFCEISHIFSIQYLTVQTPVGSV